METIQTNIRSYLACPKDDIEPCTVEKIRSSMGTPVGKFRDLVKMVASLAFHNPEYIMFFRGQKEDHKDFGSDGMTSLLPSIFRRANIDNLEIQYQKLEEAEKLLAKKYKGHD